MSEQQAGELMRQARETQDAVQKTVDIVLASLKERTQEGGKFSASKLDQHQLIAYDAALCSAEAAAARFALDYATKARDAVGASYPSPTLEERLALLFTAEARIQSMLDWQRDPMISASAGENSPRYWESNVVQGFRAAQLTPGNVAELGKAVSALDGQTGAYLLDDHHEMMQDQFRRFANEVVMPLAKEVHQKDLIIPEEILENVKELGCFGLSIPQRYEGLQDDEKEDNMGMIVVTEELSRGSLGAAGSLITRPEILARALLRGGTEEQKQKWLPRNWPLVIHYARWR
ncbi:MAG: acyl-CoA dehydrogenase family protein [Candidatus Competibacteraceae bacterium]